MALQELVQLIALVLVSGWFAALVTQLLKRSNWPSVVRLALAVVVSGLVATASAWISGDLTRFVTLWKAGAVTADQLITLGTLIFTSATAWYRLTFRGTEWAEKLGSLGDKK